MTRRSIRIWSDVQVLSHTASSGSVNDPESVGLVEEIAAALVTGACRYQSVKSILKNALD